MPIELPGTLHPSIVLSAYLEPLIEGRRVVVLGDATLGLGEDLLDRGARLVHAYDPERARVAEAVARAGPGAATVTYALLSGDLGVRDGAFDVAVVPDLSMFADPAELLRRVKRLVASGVAVIGSANPAAKQRLAPSEGTSAHGALTYYELFDAVSLQFSRIRMIGQAPFVGYTVADFAPDGEPEVSVDTSLLESSEEPEYFLAIASERPVSTEAYSVIGIPLASMLDALQGEDPTTLRGGADRLALTEAQARLTLVSAELDTMRERARDFARESEARASSTAVLSTRLAELEREVESRGTRLKELDARAGDTHVRAERLTHQIRDLEEELRRQRDRGVALSKQLDDEKKARTKAEVELGMLRGKPEIAGSKDRIDALTTELEVARARIAEIEFDHAQTLRKLAPTPPDPDVTQRLHAIEAANAEAERVLEEVARVRDAATARVTVVEAEAAVQRDQKRELAQENERLSQRLEEKGREIAELERRLELAAQSVAAKGPEKELEADVEALERALRERGKAFDALKRNLREAERIGRELIGELDELRTAELEAAPDSSDRLTLVPPPKEGWESGTEVELKHRLETLAASAARCEADLKAASWRVAQLERELDEARSGPRPPLVVHAELEQALIAAQEEVAALRRTITTASGPHAAAEQSVLLNQLSREAERG